MLQNINVSFPCMRYNCNLHTLKILLHERITVLKADFLTGSDKTIFLFVKRINEYYCIKLNERNKTKMPC